MAPECWTNSYVFVVQSADFLILWNQVTFVWTSAIFILCKGVKGLKAKTCLQEKPMGTSHCRSCRSANQLGSGAIVEQGQEH